MNQIILTPNKTPENLKFEKSKKIFLKYNLILFFCIFVILICIIIYFISMYDSYKKEKISNALMNNFTITRLYTDSNNINYNLLNNSLEIDPFVIGLLEIEKIDIMYPILSKTSDELLKIAPCRFFGPLPNTVRKSLYCRTQLLK